MNDLAYVDIRKDPEIETSPEGYQLHKINQYTMQYLLYSIRELELQNEVMSEKSEIYNRKLDKQDEIVKSQEEKIKQLEIEIQGLEEENEHQKYCIEQQKGLEAENAEKVNVLLERLRQGLTGVDDTQDYVKEFKRSMIMAESEVLKD